MSYHTISYIYISYHTIPSHIISYHTISYHIIAYHKYMQIPTCHTVVANFIWCNAKDWQQTEQPEPQF